jgi:dCMP deaminase
MRPSRDRVYLNMCRELRALATCLRGQHAALMLDSSGHVVALGYNGSPHGEPHCIEEGCLMDGDHCARCLHAEINMLLCADRERARESTVYISGRPCFRCATALVQVGVRRIVIDGRNIAYRTDDHLLGPLTAMFSRADVSLELFAEEGR